MSFVPLPFNPSRGCPSSTPPRQICLFSWFFCSCFLSLHAMFVLFVAFLWCFGVRYTSLVDVSIWAFAARFESGGFLSVYRSGVRSSAGSGCSYSSSLGGSMFVSAVLDLLSSGFTAVFAPAVVFCWFPLEIYGWFGDAGCLLSSLFCVVLVVGPVVVCIWWLCVLQRCAGCFCSWFVGFGFMFFVLVCWCLSLGCFWRVVVLSGLVYLHMFLLDPSFGFNKTFAWCCSKGLGA